MSRVFPAAYHGPAAAGTIVGESKGVDYTESIFTACMYVYTATPRQEAYQLLATGNSCVCVVDYSAVLV
jgi:hypothetical protein